MLDRLLDKFDLSAGRKSFIKAGAFVAFVIIAALLWNRFVFSPIMVSGESMNPALEEGDVIIVNRLSYVFGDLERYDIVFFPYKYDNRTKLIKRVIGLPGETVEIRDGKLYIDNKELEEYYGIYEKSSEAGVVTEGKYTFYNNWGPVTLGDDEVFVMGDNRNKSDDSRSDDVGPVKLKDIIGKVSFRLWPFNSIGSMKGQ